MNTIEILNIINKDTHLKAYFLGVFPCDKLPNKLNKFPCAVINAKLVTTLTHMGQQPLLTVLIHFYTEIVILLRLITENFSESSICGI